MGVTPVTGAVRDRREARGWIVALRRTRRGSSALYAGSVALLAVAYYLAGRIGLELAYLDGAVAALWPPAGLGLAVLFLGGVRLWPGIVIGDLLLGDFSTPFATVVAQTVGNTLALVVAALVLRRLTGGRGGLERVGRRRGPGGVRAARRGDQRSRRASGAAPWRRDRRGRAGSCVPDVDLGRRGRRPGRRAGGADVGDVGGAAASAGAMSWRAPSHCCCSWCWRSWGRSATCRTSSFRCCCGRRCASAPGAPPRRSSSSARSPSGIRRRAMGHSSALRSPTACSRPSSSSRSRPSPRCCWPR